MDLRALVAPLALCAGCTIVFDADDLRHRDAMPGAPDATPPDAIPVDADPSLLDVTGSEPEDVDEGVGGEGGRPALIKIIGDSIAPDAVITAVFVEASLAQPVVLETGVAPSQTSAVVSIQIPVLTDLAQGATRTMQLTVSQNAGATVDTVDVIINGLGELTLTAGNVAVGSLAAKYSHIDVTGDVHFTGAAPARLVATGDIVITALLDVDASDQTGGVQGCGGGANAAAGGCSGGGAGVSNAVTGGGGGGGGGYGTAGAAGGSAGAVAGGGAGPTSGDDMLIPFLTGGTGAGNRGAGGGGGGNGLLAAAGGRGGGGGGVIQVVAGGDIELSGGGGIRARGGDGAAANGSGGGGGAGGAILVRAGGSVTGNDVLAAPGGDGADAAGAGGAGGLGRIRVDAPDGEVPDLASTPEAIRGPAWDDSMPVIMRNSTTTFQMRGPPGRQLGVTLDGEALDEDFTLGTNGTKTLDAMDLDMPLGVHEVCVVYTGFDDVPDVSTPEALSCVTVAYYP